MLWNFEVLYLTEALTNFLGVVARFPESVVVAGLIGLLVTGEKNCCDGCHDYCGCENY
jgi:hypothetical protein